MERTTADVCLQQSLRSYMQQTLNFMSWCMGSIAIPTVVTVKTEILLCSNRLSIPTSTYKTHLSSMWSKSCNIQHLVHPQSQHTTQWSMFWKRTFCHYWQANMAHWQALHMKTSSSEYRQQMLGRRTGPSPWSVAQRAIQKVCCSGERRRNSLLKQQREGEMDRGLCGKSDRCGKNASWRHRVSN